MDIYISCFFFNPRSRTWEELSGGGVVSRGCVEGVLGRQSYYSRTHRIDFLEEFWKRDRGRVFSVSDHLFPR